MPSGQMTKPGEHVRGEGQSAMLARQTLGLGHKIFVEAQVDGSMQLVPHAPFGHRVSPEGHGQPVELATHDPSQHLVFVKSAQAAVEASEQLL
jgi:hypothetical protein